MEVLNYTDVFNNYSEYKAKGCKIIPNVSYIKDSGHVYYNERIDVGDYLYDNGMISNCLLEGEAKPIAVCVISEDTLGDGYYRFMSIRSSGRIGAFDPAIIEGDESTYYENPNLKHGWHYPALNPETGEYQTTKLYGWFTSPGMEKIYPDIFTVQINGYWYPSIGTQDLAHRGYAPPVYNQDGSKNELFWSESVGGYNNPAMDLDGEANTKAWVETGRNLPLIKFCTDFAPGFKNGEWYMPSDGEMALMCWNRAILMDKYIAAKEFLNLPNQGTVTLKNPGPSYYTSTEHSNYNERCFSLEGSAQTSTLRNKNSTPYETVPFLKIDKNYKMK